MASNGGIVSEGGPLPRMRRTPWGQCPQMRTNKLPIPRRFR